MRAVRVPLLLTLVMAAMLLTGCSTGTAASNNMLNSAHTITEEMLTGMNEADYAKFTRHFDLKMRDSMPETQFRATKDDIQSKIGKYISKEYTGSEKQQGYSVLLYRGKFSETDDVVIRMVFSEENGNLLVAGFWLDSPVLRK